MQRAFLWLLHTSLLAFNNMPPLITKIKFHGHFIKGTKHLKASLWQRIAACFPHCSHLPVLGRGQPCKTALFSKILRAALTTACWPWLGFFLAIVCPGTDGLFTEALESIASWTLGAITTFHNLDIHLWMIHKQSFNLRENEENSRFDISGNVSDFVLSGSSRILNVIFHISKVLIWLGKFHLFALYLNAWPSFFSHSLANYSPSDAFLPANTNAKYPFCA